VEELQGPLVSHPFSNNSSIYSSYHLAVRKFAQKLDPHKHELTLITARTHFAYLPAGLRLLVSRHTPLDTVFMSYDKVFDNFPGRLSIGKATSVEADPGGRGGKVILDTGDEVLYDVVVVATGSSWEGLVDFPNDERLYREFIEEWRNKFENANDVVIVGGGAVGIGEVCVSCFSK
jgi:apoptosis-inducing factor 2